MATRIFFFFSRGKKRKKLKTDRVPWRRTEATTSGGPSLRRAVLSLRTLGAGKAELNKINGKRECYVHVYLERAELSVPKQKKNPVEKGVKR